MFDTHGTRQYDTSVLAYYFNIQLNQALEQGRTTHTLRGLRSALRDPDSQQEYADRFGDQLLPSMLFDSHNARQSVDLICARCRTKPFTHFVTITLDMQRFPGVRELYHQLELAEVDLEYFLVHLTRAWQRASKLLFRLMLADPRFFGEVDDIFAHAEWQDKDARGIANFCHWHIGLSTHHRINDPDPTTRRAAIEDAMSYLKCTIEGAFDFLGDPQLAKEWEDKARATMRHKCSQKCQVQVGTGDDTICKHGAPWRVHQGTRHHTIKADIPPNLEALLLEEGLAIRDEATGKVTLCDELIAHVYEAHRGNGNERTSSFVPLLFIATGGTHHNSQLIYGTRYLLAYLVAYMAAEEERCLVRLTKASESTTTAHVQDEYRRKQATKGVKVRPGQGRLIAMSEMAWLVLGYSTIFCTFMGVRVNTGAPEGR